MYDRHCIEHISRERLLAWQQQRPRQTLQLAAFVFDMTLSRTHAMEHFLAEHNIDSDDFTLPIRYKQTNFASVPLPTVLRHEVTGFTSR